MIVLASAALLAVSATCMAWYGLHVRATRALVTNRLAHLPQGVSFPYNLNSSDSAERASNAVMSLEDSYKTKMARKLYLAGFRNKKSSTFFQWLVRLSVITPIIIVLTGFLTGTFTPNLAIRAAVVGFGFYFVSHFFLKSHRQKIERQMTRTLPQVLDLLIVSLEAGLNFTAALPRVLDEMEQNDPLIKEFRILHNEYLGGLSFAQACGRLVQRCDISDLSVIINALVESEQTGASLAHVLRVHSGDLRDKYRQRLREKAHKLPVKLIFPMMLIFLTIFTIALGPSIYQLNNSNITMPDAKVQP